MLGGAQSPDVPSTSCGCPRTLRDPASSKLGSVTFRRRRPPSAPPPPWSCQTPQGDSSGCHGPEADLVHPPYGAGLRNCPGAWLRVLSPPCTPVLCFGSETAVCQENLSRSPCQGLRFPICRMGSLEWRVCKRPSKSHLLTSP